MADNKKYACGYKNSETGEIFYFKDDEARTQCKDIAKQVKDVQDSILESGNLVISDYVEGTIYIKKVIVDENSYKITNNLTDVTNSNVITKINKNTAYNATLTAKTGYILGTVTITMAGNDVTSTVYNNGVINISSVIGDVIITANAIAQTGLQTKFALLNTDIGLDSLEQTIHDHTVKMKSIPTRNSSNNNIVINGNYIEIVNNDELFKSDYELELKIKLLYDTVPSGITLLDMKYTEYGNGSTKDIEDGYRVMFDNSTGKLMVAGRQGTNIYADDILISNVYNQELKLKIVKTTSFKVYINDVLKITCPNSNFERFAVGSYKNILIGGLNYSGSSKCEFESITIKGAV